MKKILFVLLVALCGVSFSFGDDKQQCINECKKNNDEASCIIECQARQSSQTQAVRQYIVPLGKKEPKVIE